MDDRTLSSQRNPSALAKAAASTARPDEPTSSSCGFSILFSLTTGSTQVQVSIRPRRRRQREFLSARAAADRGAPDVYASRATSAEHSRAAVAQKILVLGASGKIGRLVVRHLLDSSIDATIVAYCRDYDKACRVLFDDMIAVKATAATTTHRKHSGPTLQIVQGELVPTRQPMNEHDVETFLDDFYNETASHHVIEHNHLYSLAQAIHGASVIISYVGSTRTTNPWKDLMERPFWRLLRPNVSAWCQDSRHPYYAHYLSTRLVLLLAEREEQERRQRLQQQQQQQSSSLSSDSTIHKKRSPTTPSSSDQPAASNGPLPRPTPPQQSRLRIVRISDLSVGQKSWYLVPILTNLIQSMVLRYQEMAERTLHDSDWIETIVLRPGDLVSWNHHYKDVDYDEDDAGERDTNTTAVQVGIHGWVPEPSRIGRDDVAALAVAAALHDGTKKALSSSISDSDKMIQRKTWLSQSPTTAAYTTDTDDDTPLFHYTLACRWVGEDMHPFPPQGRMSDGHVDAHVAMDAALTALSQKTARRREFEDKMSRQTTTTTSSPTLPFARTWRLFRSKRHRRLKPYGLCVAVPTYFFLYMLATRLLHSCAMLCGDAPLLQPLLTWMTSQPWLRHGGHVVASVAKALIGFVWRKSSSQQYIQF